jgi:hypothetical protein
MFGVGRNCGERLGRNLEQQSVDRSLVLVCDRTDSARNGKNNMKISNRQKVGFARRKPCGRRGPLTFRATPMPTGIERDASVRTVLTPIDMAAKRGCATDLDRRHYTALREA